MTDKLIDRIGFKSSTFIFGCIGLVWLISFVVYQPWEVQLVKGADATGYYFYLPATFIYQDLPTLEKSDLARSQYYRPNQKTKYPNLGNGNHVIIYTYGVALMNSIPFGIIHTGMKLLGEKADGYSLPYRIGLLLNGVIFAFLGLIFLRKFLLFHVEELWVNWTIFCLGLGTNLYYMGVLMSGMSHGFLFFWISLFLYTTHRWHKDGNPKLLYFIAFIGGMIGLIRPNLLILGLVPIFYTAQTLQYLQKKPWLVLPLVFIFLLPWLPQFVYWRMVTGHFLYDSYGDSAGFNFTDPQIWKGLLSFQNGWLIYSPIMIFSILGLVYSLVRRKQHSVLISFLFALHLYIIYSWFCWSYINGFGSRAMVEFLPVLALPFAYFFQSIGTKKWLSISLYLICGFFIILNLFQSYQNHQTKALNSENANFAYYKSIFFQPELDHDALVALDADNEQLTGGGPIKELYFNDFEKDETADTLEVFEGKRSCQLNKDREFSPGLKTTFKELGVAEGQWIRLSLAARSGAYKTFLKNAALVLSIDDSEGENLYWRGLRINNKIRDTYFTIHNGETNRWKAFGGFFKIPEGVIAPDHRINVYVWNPQHQLLYVDNLKVELWEAL